MIKQEAFNQTVVFFGGGAVEMGGGWGKELNGNRVLESGESITCYS